MQEKIGYLEKRVEVKQRMLDSAHKAREAMSQKLEKMNSNNRTSA